MAANQGKVRIIGGNWRSRVINFPVRPDLRPTPDRVRETLFNWLGQNMEGMRCLDLFAGSGVLGFEAASRGAGQVVMVEFDSLVYKALRENKEKLRATQIELIRMAASVYLDANAKQFDVVFLDPPFRLEILPDILHRLPQFLTKGGLVYLETRDSWVPDTQWHVRRQGKAGKVNYYLMELYRE